MPKKPPPCSALVQDKPSGRVDVCGLDSGHAGHHEGKYKGMVWEGKGTRAKIISGGGSPIHNLPPQPGEPPQTIRRGGGREDIVYPHRANASPQGWNPPRDLHPEPKDVSITRRRRIRSGSGEHRRRNTIVEG